jgi:ABC-type sugar transport system ATPase subunit
MEVKLENLSKRWGKIVGADHINLDINDGEFVAFLGPSGCGKTTTLLMVAGIYKPTEGTIRFGERVVNHVEPKDRNIGMVFQSYALYPHMTVFQNISYPLKLWAGPWSKNLNCYSSTNHSPTWTRACASPCEAKSNGFR